MLRLLLLMPFVLNLLAAPAGATILAEAAVRTAVFSGATFSPICSDGGFGSGYAETSCDEAGNVGSGRARTSYGSLEAYADLSSVLSIDFNADYQSFGRSHFSDVLTASSPLLEPGLETNARIVLDVSGSVFKDGPAFNELGDMFTIWSLRVTVNGVEQSPSTGSVNLAGENFYDFSIYPDAPILFLAELIADVRCFGCDVPYEGIVDLFGTASLIRMEVGGLDPSDFTVTSGENARYANIVPEIPGSTTTTTTGPTTTTTITFPPGLCGDINGDGVTATDALRVLQAAVGSETSCQLCTCDVDSSGAISATDALRVLQAAVGVEVDLTCVPCG
jgi:hypothetical protein